MEIKDGSLPRLLGGWGLMELIRRHRRRAVLETETIKRAGVPADPRLIDSFVQSVYLVQSILILITCFKMTVLPVQNLEARISGKHL